MSYLVKINQLFLKQYHFVFLFIFLVLIYQVWIVFERVNQIIKIHQD
jgi:hypothetical protein